MVSFLKNGQRGIKMGIKRKRARLQKYLENKMKESVTNIEFTSTEITTQVDEILTQAAEFKTTAKTATTKTTKTTTKKKAVAKKTTTAKKK